jgi:predicted Holliday junction resolvase-like endonuclease
LLVYHSFVRATEIYRFSLCRYHTNNGEGITMWTIILTFLKNPKNLIIVILAVLFALCMGMILYQRASLATKTAKIELQAKDIEQFKAAQTAYSNLIDQYAEQVVKWQKLAESHQAITNQTAKETVKIKYIKSKCTLEGEDAKAVNGIFNYFNHGLLDN